MIGELLKVVLAAVLAGVLAAVLVESSGCPNAPGGGVAVLAAVVGLVVARKGIGSGVVNTIFVGRFGVGWVTLCDPLKVELGDPLKVELGDPLKVDLVMSICGWRSVFGSSSNNVEHVASSNKIHSPLDFNLAVLYFGSDLFKYDKQHFFFASLET